MQKWIVIVVLALMPAVSISNVCALSFDLAKVNTAADADVAPCENGPCSYANLCDLAQSVFIPYTPVALDENQCSDRIADALEISTPAEPNPPLKPPVV
jgi:hypothetical protein